MASCELNLSVDVGDLEHIGHELAEIDVSLLPTHLREQLQSVIDGDELVDVDFVALDEHEFNMVARASPELSAIMASIRAHIGSDGLR